MASIAVLAALGAPLFVGGILGISSGHLRFAGIKMFGIDMHTLLGGSTDSWGYNSLLMLVSAGLIGSGICLTFGAVCKMFNNKKNEGGELLFCGGVTCSFIGALILSHKLTLFSDIVGVEFTKMLYK